LNSPVNPPSSNAIPASTSVSQSCSFGARQARPPQEGNSYYCTSQRIDGIHHMFLHSITEAAENGPNSEACRHDNDSDAQDRSNDAKSYYQHIKEIYCDNTRLDILAALDNCGGTRAGTGRRLLIAPTQVRFLPPQPLRKVKPMGDGSRKRKRSSDEP
jgi:hypothetical protein